MRFFNLLHCFLAFRLVAHALTAPPPLGNLNLTTASLSLSNPATGVDATSPLRFTLSPHSSISSPVELSSLTLLDNPPDPYYYKPSGYTLAVIFSSYRFAIRPGSVIAAAEKGWVEAVATHHGAKASVGTATKMYTVGNAQLVIRPNAKMTWAMFQQACLWIMEVYSKGLNSESILGFLDDAHEGNVGSGEVRLIS